MKKAHSHLNVASISLLPKKGKDHSECSNCHAISLIHSDIKLYAQVLALCLGKYMDKLFHSDQSGFMMKARLAANNIQRLVHVIYQVQELDDPCAILPLDAEKAFDWLEPEYLWIALEKFDKYDLRYVPQPIGYGYYKWFTF